MTSRPTKSIKYKVEKKAIFVTKDYPRLSLLTDVSEKVSFLRASFDFSTTHKSVSVIIPSSAGLLQIETNMSYLSLPFYITQ